MRVFLTGGTGLIGSHLAELLRARGHEVVALCRVGADTLHLAGLECRVVEGDVRDPIDALAAAMSGCTHVVHGAALVYAGGSWPEIRAVNVDGTRNVLRAAAEAHVDHALHLSSVAVYGTVDGEVDEDAPLDRDLPTNDLYARSKREAEEVARGVEERRGIPVSVMRPSAVYGERDRLLVPALADILRLPLVPLFGRGDNTLPVVYAGNVATAMLRVMDAARGGAAATFDLGLDHPLTQRALLEGVAEGLGVAPRWLHLPAGLVRGAVRTLTAVGVKTPGAPHLPLERVARLALGENPYASRRIRDELGWTPEHAHDDALHRSGRSFAGAA